MKSNQLTIDAIHLNKHKKIMFVKKKPIRGLLITLKIYSLYNSQNKAFYDAIKSIQFIIM